MTDTWRPLALGYDPQNRHPHGCHPFRPVILSDGTATVICRCCNDLWDSPNHDEEEG